MFSRRNHPTQLVSAVYRIDPPADDVATLPTEKTVDESVKDLSTIPAPVAPIPIANHRLNDRSAAITLWLRRGDQLFLGFLLIALLVLLIAFRWKLSGGWRTPIEIVSQQPREYFYSIDINNASWVEWAQLDGIGEKLARRIVKDREDRGPFRSIDDLRRVKGLGPKLVEKLRPFLSSSADMVEPQDNNRAKHLR